MLRSLLVGAAVAVLAPLWGPGAGTAAPSSCEPWAMTTVAHGLGSLENLALDGRGGLLLSQNNLVVPGSLDSLDPSGQVSTVVAGVDSPGGIVVRDRVAYFVTGDSTWAALPGGPTGTVDAVDLDTGARWTVARGLVAPNGLAGLPSGDLVVSGRTGLTLVPASGSAPRPYALDGVAVNGLGLDPSGRWLYVGTSVDPVPSVYRVDVTDPGAPPQRWTIPDAGLFPVPDDLAVDSDGRVYIALNFAGLVVRLDTATGQACTLASGLTTPTSVRFGSERDVLYVSSFDGTVTSLRPP
ncbi:MAG TPA: SMP-30/gluconolactonase/LRE family protein [Aldersonia sp.]